MKEVIYEDENLIALDKKPGVVVFSDKEDSLSLSIIKHYPYLKGVGGVRNGAAHRLDKDTSGIVLFAKNEKVLDILQKEFFNRKIKKKYIALVFKRISKDNGEIISYMGRSPKDRRKQRVSFQKKGTREAVTRFRTIKRFKAHSLLEVFPETGRKHQIRCHLAHIGHPVAGDKLYGFKDQKDPPELKRQFLHASSVKVSMPEKKLVIESCLPKDLKEIIHKMEKDVC